MKDSLRLPLSQRDSGSEEGGSSPAGSPRPERGSLGGVIKSTHRALLGSSSLLASVGLGRCLDIPPRVPPRTNASFLGDRTPSEPEICPIKPVIPDPPVVDDLITFSTSEMLPRSFLDLPLQYQDIKPLPLTPPPPIPRERSAHRMQQTLHSPQSPRTPPRHGRGSPAERTPTTTSTNGELDFEAWAHRAERRRSSQGLHGSQLGPTFCCYHAPYCLDWNCPSDRGRTMRSYRWSVYLSFTVSQVSGNKWRPCILSLWGRGSDLYNSPLTSF